MESLRELVGDPGDVINVSESVIYPPSRIVVGCAMLVSHVQKTEFAVIRNPLLKETMPDASTTFSSAETITNARLQRASRDLATAFVISVSGRQ